MKRDHYVAVMHLPQRQTIEVGALGIFDFEAGDWAYIGRAQRGFDARLERHRRHAGPNKTLRWHVDYVREPARWVRAHAVSRARAETLGGECGLADHVADLPGAGRRVPDFGSSDCRCDGHLVHVPEGIDPEALPGRLWRGEGVPGAFVARPNRFVMEVALEGGETVEAYLPNTSRLTELLVPGTDVLVEPADDPSRTTDFTVTRMRSPAMGEWVALEAVAAEDLFVDWVERREAIPGWEDRQVADPASLEAQVSVENHRLDFRTTLDDGTTGWIEVKSLSRTVDGVGLLSETPSTRGAEHLEFLGDRVEAGDRALCVFVVQRQDARWFRVGGDAEPGWIEAVERARRRGVEIAALGCRVTPSNVWVDRRLQVRWDMEP
jgi:sugar fermentation stimulation protein A